MAVRETGFEELTKGIWAIFQGAMDLLEERVTTLTTQNDQAKEAARSTYNAPDRDIRHRKPATWAEMAKRATQDTTKGGQAAPGIESARKAKRVTIRVDDQEERK